MRIARFYLDQPLKVGSEVLLSEAVFNHAIRVLRLRQGEALVLFNGEGVEYRAQLSRVEKRQAWVLLESCQPAVAESSLALTLVQGVSKGERMDYSLQKAVELGVQRIIPVLTERSVVNLDQERWQRRHEHWQGLMIAACEQCGRGVIPQLLPVQPLCKWLASTDSDLRLVLDPCAATSVRQLPIVQTQPISLLIGPEGGLSTTELHSALQVGCIGVRLGPRILRTESAGVTALAALQVLWGDLAE